MIMIYSINNPPKLLKDGDQVIFKVDGETFHYTVFSNYLGLPGNQNYLIFHKLGMENRHKYASEVYGYTTDAGGWPSSRNGDYLGMTRLVWFVFGEILKKVDVDFSDYINPSSLETLYPKIPEGKKWEEALKEIARKMVAV